MRFRVQNEFKVNRTRLCRPPWPVFGDAEFEILRAGDNEFSEWLSEHHRESLISKKANSVLIHAQLARQGSRNKSKGDEAADRVIRAADFDNAVSVFEETNLESAKRLLKGWQNLRWDDGVAAEFSESARDEIFAIDYVTVPETVLGEEDEPETEDEDEDEASNAVTIVDGASLGMAMVHWVLFEARRHEEYREGWIEEQEKN